MNQKRLSITKATLHPSDEDDRNVRQQFEEEMDKIEEEMTKYRKQVESLQQEYYKSPSRTLTAAPIDLPVIQDTAEGKILRLCFDVSEFKPQEIDVKVVNNVFQVDARHEDREDAIYTLREYQRQFVLPAETELQRITADISDNGMLNLTVPLPEVIQVIGLVRK